MFNAFGSLPKGKSLEKVKSSPHYKSGAFRNLSPAIMDVGFKVVLKMLNRPESVRPPFAMPSIKTNLRTLQSPDPVLIWFGHSSYFIQLEGKNILVDPVFSGNASPFSFSMKAFRGSDIYTVDDLPQIDLLILTHDHYDHLDYKTLKQLRGKVKNVVCPVGVAAHLQYWKVDNVNITELDWWESIQLDNISITATPAKHFSGRVFKRGQSLWASFVLKCGRQNVFIGGDSGYDSHFKTIGEKFGPFNLSILECGQYNDHWKAIHMMPEETVKAAMDLGSRLLLPVHWGKFGLAMHPWNEPVERVTSYANEAGQPVTTPRIGEPVHFMQDYPTKQWWK